MLESLRDHCEAVEECYEFMLAYAAQGLPGDTGSSSGEKLRVLLKRAAGSLSGLPEAYEAAISEANLQPADRHFCISFGAQARCRRFPRRRGTGFVTTCHKFTADR